MSEHIAKENQNLTKRQSEILDFIVIAIQKNGYPPSIRELMKPFGIKSPNGIACHLKVLKANGYIDWHPSKQRTIRVLGGEPDKAEETLDDLLARIQKQLPKDAVIRVIFRKEGTAVYYKHDGIEGNCSMLSSGLASQIEHAVNQVQMIQAAKRCRKS